MSYEEALYEREAIGMEKGEEKGIKKGEAIGKIKGAVETYFDFGKSPEETAAAIIKKFSLSDDEAKEYMRLYYPAAD